MELVKPLQSPKVTTVTLQMPSNSSYTLFKNYRPTTAVVSKLELQPREEVRLYGAVSKKALRQQEFIITNSRSRRQYHYMLKNFHVIKIKWERCFASHLSVSPTLILHVTFTALVSSVSCLWSGQI